MMTNVLALALAAVAVAALAWVVFSEVRTWRRLHGPRLVMCPETGRPAAVRLDVKHAALGILDGDQSLRLTDCSRWAERGRCDGPCAPEAGRAGSAVRQVAEAWFSSKTCVYCRKPVATQFLDHHAALLTPNGITIEWNELPPERLPDAMQTHLPVCWDCHIAETFRRKFPELVTDR
jgi:hypothetical protein